jgi:dihydrofolate reductase
MRRIITTTFVTLDGVMQAPGGKEEDTSGGFEHGGWQIHFPSGKGLEKRLADIFGSPFELLLGKKTYDIFAAFWPTTETDPEVAQPFNSTRKYVVSHESFEPTWNNSVSITGDVATQLRKLKEEEGPDLWVWGSGNLIQTLIKEHLVDQMQVWIYPITIGTGKKLFAEGTQPENFKLVESEISETGVIFAAYEPVGPLK